MLRPIVHEPSSRNWSSVRNADRGDQSSSGQNRREVRFADESRIRQDQAPSDSPQQTPQQFRRPTASAGCVRKSLSLVLKLARSCSMWVRYQCRETETRCVHEGKVTFHGFSAGSATPRRRESEFRADSADTRRFLPVNDGLAVEGGISQPVGHVVTAAAGSSWSLEKSHLHPYVARQVNDQTDLRRPDHTPLVTASGRCGNRGVHYSDVIRP